MQGAVQIQFLGLSASQALAAYVEENLAHLEKLFGRVTEGRVVVEETHHRHRKGNIFRVGIELNVPGRRLVVGREPGKDHAHEDPYVAIRDAFQAMQRVVRDHARKVRQEVKHHDSPLLTAQVVRLFPYEGYGFITTNDGREVYFHENSVLNDRFPSLEVGAKVRFAEEAGEKGPQASTVHGS